MEICIPVMKSQRCTNTRLIHFAFSFIFKFGSAWEVYIKKASSFSLCRTWNFFLRFLPFFFLFFFLENHFLVLLFLAYKAVIAC